MRLLRWLFAPLLILIRGFLYPLRRRRRTRALGPHGWLELHLEGEIHELRPTETRGQRWVRRILRRPTPKRIVLSRLRKMVDEALGDPRCKGILVQLGPLGGGWASADAVHQQLARFKAAQIPVLVHLKGHAGNRELLVASSASKLWMTPSGGLAAAGSAAQGLYLQPLLARLGIKVEVAHRGRYKSAPDQLTRTERSEPDREQAQALVDAFDEALLTAAGALYGTDRAGAERFVDRAPMVGTQALSEGYCHALLRDEDLTRAVATQAGVEDQNPKKRFRLVGAGGYLEARTPAPLFRRRRKRIGIVEVHGAIVDQGPGPTPLSGGKSAVDAAVVADLRAALTDPQIGAVVLHVDSRGGSVTASDSIYAAVRRLNQEKPVIACFGDVAASGGYYVACGARAIVAAPLTVTGSIGVFALIPTWPELGSNLEIHHDVIKNRHHAGLYDPWRGFNDQDRAAADVEVGAMYETFLALVAEARKKTRDEIHAVADGRVWIGKSALEVGLVDGLGGLPEAVERAKAAFGKPVEADPVLVKARMELPRPLAYLDPTPPTAPSAIASWMALLPLLGERPELEVLTELYSLSSGRARQPHGLAYLPMSWR